MDSETQMPVEAETETAAQKKERLDVEASRQKRLARVKAKHRDRGGIYTPAETNPLLDILLARDVSGRSPEKVRPTPASGRKSLSATAGRAVGDKGGLAARSKPRASSGRKSVAGANGLESETVSKTKPKPRASGGRKSIAAASATASTSNVRRKSIAPPKQGPGKATTIHDDDEDEGSRTKAFDKKKQKRKSAPKPGASTSMRNKKGANLDADISDVDGAIREPESVADVAGPSTAPKRSLDAIDGADAPPRKRARADGEPGSKSVQARGKGTRKGKEKVHANVLEAADEDEVGDLPSGSGAARGAAPAKSKPKPKPKPRQPFRKKKPEASTDGDIGTETGDETKSKTGGSGRGRGNGAGKGKGKGRGKAKKSEPEPEPEPGSEPEEEIRRPSFKPNLETVPEGASENGEDEAHVQNSRQGVPVLQKRRREEDTAAVPVRSRPDLRDDDDTLPSARKRLKPLISETDGDAAATAKAGPKHKPPNRPLQGDKENNKYAVDANTSEGPAVSAPQSPPPPLDKVRPKGKPGPKPKPRAKPGPKPKPKPKLKQRLEPKLRLGPDWSVAAKSKYANLPTTLMSSPLRARDSEDELDFLS